MNDQALIETLRNALRPFAKGGSVTPLQIEAAMDAMKLVSDSEEHAAYLERQRKLPMISRGGTRPASNGTPGALSEGPIFHQGRSGMADQA